MVDDQVVDAERQKQDLGILFVHGIGAQERGETLATFGAPIYQWIEQRFAGIDRRWRESGDPVVEASRQAIEDWASDGFDSATMPSVDHDPGSAPVDTVKLAAEIGCPVTVARASLDDAVVHDPADAVAPATAKLRLEQQSLSGQVSQQQWLLAESWWAETFATPKFGDLARWGVSVIPWMLGSHFGTRVRRLLRRRPDTSDQHQGVRALRWVAWTAGLVASFLGLIGALLLSPFLLLAFGVMLLLALIPIAALRNALLHLQLKFASTIGDSFVLLTRPIEAASIIGQVRRDMAWLAQRCKHVVVVAHSQGGAVAHKAIQKGAPDELRILFTFGSGLKKLEQLEFLVSSGRSYRFSAALTIIAVPIVGLTTAWLIWALFGGIQQIDRPENAAWMVAWLVAGLLVLNAGLRDLIRGINPEKLKRWVKRLDAMNVEWVDCFAIADPVSNGQLMDDPVVAKKSVEVCNEASMAKDHTSYWHNRDEFVTTLMDRIVRSSFGNAGIEYPDLQTEPKFLAFLGKRRRWRTGIRRALFWAMIATLIAAIVKTPESYVYFATYLHETISSWFVRLFGGTSNTTQDLGIAWPAIGWLAIAFLPYLVVQVLWRRWNEREMQTLIQGALSSGRNTAVLTGIWFQLLVMLWLATDGFPPTWLSLLSLFGIVVPSVVLEPSLPGARAVAPYGSAHEPRSAVESVWIRSNALFAWVIGVIAVPFFLAFSAWNGLTWLIARTSSGSVMGFQPERIPAIWVGAAVALLAVLLAILSITKRRPTSGDQGNTN